MNLLQLLKTVTESDPSDWNVVNCGGGIGNGGPSFLDLTSSWTGGNGTNGVEIDSHYGRAAYLHDVSIGLAWGLSDADDRRTFDWANNFADDVTWPTLVDVLYNGMLIHRETGLVVDGGRVTLPFPRAVFDRSDPRNTKVIGEEVTQQQVAIFRLVHDLGTDAYDFGDYLRRSTLTVVAR